jgi:hypothetical protein
MCVHEGMSYYEVANAISVEGEPRGLLVALKFTVYGWNGIWTGGYAIIEGQMSAIFHDGILVSKAQYGLPSDPNLN